MPKLFTCHSLICQISGNYFQLKLSVEISAEGSCATVQHQNKFLLFSNTIYCQMMGLNNLVEIFKDLDRIPETLGSLFTLFGIIFIIYLILKALMRVPELLKISYAT